MAESKLFKPLVVGTMKLKHRVGMCPLTRFRATETHTPTPTMKEYYTQRASVAGTLLVTEGTFISPLHSGFPFIPGIFSDAQIAGWREITDAVHEKGSFIVCQLWVLGRSVSPEKAAADGNPILSSSDVPVSPGQAVPVPMTVEQIQQTIQEYAHAAKCAIKAGFDAVEIHGANGYLIDQFLQEHVNHRTDDYGGSIENRSRFVVEVAKAVSAAVGPEKTGLRLSPFSTYNNMGLPDPIPQFSDVISRINELGIAYIHLVEPRVDGTEDVVDYNKAQSLDFAFKLWKGPVLVAGGYDGASARSVVDVQHSDRDVVVMFGRHFISNPDLPFRIKEGVAFQPYRRDLFYKVASPDGYTDEPFSKEFLASVKVEA